MEVREVDLAEPGIRTLRWAWTMDPLGSPSEGGTPASLIPILVWLVAALSRELRSKSQDPGDVR